MDINLKHVLNVLTAAEHVRQSMTHSSWTRTGKLIGDTPVFRPSSQQRLTMEDIEKNANPPSVRKTPRRQDTGRAQSTPSAPAAAVKGAAKAHFTR